MKLTYLTQLNLHLFRRRGRTFIVSVRLINYNSLNSPNRIANPLKRKIRPPIGIVNETRIANRICVTVLGNGAIGQPRCVGLFTDLKSYFFNCGEGIGRICREYDINACLVKHLFITQKTWENLSGVPDIFLSNNAFNVVQMSIHGPPGVEHVSSMILAEKMHTTKFVKKNPLNGHHIDHTLKIEYVPIMLKNNMQQFHIHKKGNQKKNDGSNVVFSYICEIFEKPGEFLAEKCVEHGISVGPDLLKLKNGENVILESGKIVSPEDVHNPPYPGTVLLVVDCPSESFLESFVSEKKFEKYQLPLNISSEVSAVFHFTPPDVYSSSKYQEWMSRFHQDTQHFILNSDCPTASSIAVHQTQRCFNLLHSEVFKNLKDVMPSFQNLFSSPTVLHAPPMLQLHIRPEKNLSWTNVFNPDSDINDDTAPVRTSQEFYDSLKDLKTILAEKSLLNDDDDIYPEVVFFGTSSSTSTACRNVSAILLNTNLHNSILLDCGEGTVTQYARYYGSDMHAMLRNLSCIFISHKHTDHYMGLFQLVRERIKAFENFGVPYEPVVLILPYEVESVLRHFSEIFNNLLPAVKVFSCHYLRKKREYNLKKYLGNLELITVPVQHCLDAHGIIIQSGSEWKIVYSGDTGPCQRLIDAGMNCTLLIHETSIEDGLENEALMKKHSTPSQLINAAERMNAQYTIATHFSKRYLAVPVFPECNYRHIACAFDFMKVRMCDMPLLPLFGHTIKCLFQEQLQTHVERTSSVVNFNNTFLKVLKS